MNQSWWGYLHTNGSIQVKPVLWTYADDYADAYQSPFVKQVFSSFPASSREDAIAIISDKLKALQ